MESLEITTELEIFFSVLDWLHAPGPYVTESIFTLLFSGFVISMYIIMKIKKKQKENIS